ncbi:MAG: hypothetical protein DRP15_03485, partial [Candidatus Aenigmatarchaeota archaeon]
MDKTKKITADIEQIFGFNLNHNQRRECERLVFEILKTGLNSKDILTPLKNILKDKKLTGQDKFLHIKKTLVKLLFPLTSKKTKIAAEKLFLAPLPENTKEAWHPKGEFKPEKIFVEEKVKKSYLENRFHKLFPEIEIIYVERIAPLRKELNLSVADFKKPYVFIVKENWDFIKPCPCTKGHLGCGYWILNLGFGCPFDCSYCYLQQYQNFPGIILPANLEDFFAKSEAFLNKIGRPIRVGTGEFCDSLALDHITEYSKQLVPFFAKKKVFFELKTKSSNIQNLLEIPAAENIIISWSLNPQEIIDTEELNTASLKQRLSAAKKVQDKGYSLAFHFDPVIYTKKWENLYQKVIDKLYSFAQPPFAW